MTGIGWPKGSLRAALIAAGSDYPLRDLPGWVFTELAELRFGALGEASAPSSVFHYTSVEGLRGILHSIRDTPHATLWATHSQFLNDSTEWDSGAKFVDRVLLEHMELGAFEGMDVSARLSRLLSPARGDGVFVASFSARADDLSQWRAYGQGVGYAIEFDLRSLDGTRAADHHNVIRVGKVAYTDPEKRGLVDRALAAMSPVGRAPREYPPLAQSLALRLALESVIPLMKDPAFADEAEWRILATPRKGAPPAEFRSSHGALAPYVRLKIPSKQILSITVGPCPDPARSRDGLEMLLEASGFSSIEVQVSGAPFRDW